MVEHHGERLIEPFRWGLVPWYAEDRKGAARLINARSETVEQSPAFRTSFAKRRLIVPAAAFYEWHRVDGRRDPFAIRRHDGNPMALAGVWAIWRDPDTGERVYTCSILTTVPNDLVSRIHNRMPVILDPADWDLWLSEDARPHGPAQAPLPRTRRGPRRVPGLTGRQQRPQRGSRAAGTGRVTALDVPSDALVLLIGAAGSGKSTLAARHFPPEAILSSDAYRAAVSGDAADQSATDAAFERLQADLDQRMRAGQLTVVDATNVQGWARRRLLASRSSPWPPGAGDRAGHPARGEPAAERGAGGSAGAGAGRSAPGSGPSPIGPAARRGGLCRRRRPLRPGRSGGAQDPDTTKCPEGTAPDPLMQSPESSPGP